MQASTPQLGKTLVMAVAVDPDTCGAIAAVRWYTDNLDSTVDLSQVQVTLFDMPVAISELKNKKSKTTGLPAQRT